MCLPTLATKYIGRVLLTFLVAFSGLILSTSSIFAATFDIHSNDVTGLINAINISNSNGEDNIINLDHNSTYLLTNKIRPIPCRLIPHTRSFGQIFGME